MLVVALLAIAAASCGSPAAERAETVTAASDPPATPIPELPRGLVYMFGDSNLPSNMPGTSLLLHVLHGRIPYITTVDSLWGLGFVTGSAPSPQLQAPVVGALRSGVSRTDPDVVFIELGTVDLSLIHI
ncbi:MAG: hypothetical protein N2037_02065, partial [Acidimicrobiales bacterium]|nr:hypothetical protein [Acidimicrobiales bacterium]